MSRKRTVTKKDVLLSGAFIALACLSAYLLNADGGVLMISLGVGSGLAALAIVEKLAMDG
jgi:hypothetical protein